MKNNENPNTEKWKSAVTPPTKCGTYRVWIINSEYGEREVCDHYNSVKQVWGFEVCGWGNVTHWRPLTAPPEITP